MAFNSSSHVKTAMVCPEDLLFTQPDIKPTFTDPEYPSVRETASLISRGWLDADLLGPLHVSTDKNGRMWCDNNRRLFALREAGLSFILVVFDGTRRPAKSLKSMLSDPDFMPRIRGEPVRVRISTPPTSSGRNACDRQKESRIERRIGYAEVVPSEASRVRKPPPSASGRNACERQKEAKDKNRAGYDVVESFEALRIRSPPPPASGRNARERKKERRIEHRSGIAVVEPSEKSRVRIPPPQPPKQDARERKKEPMIEHRVGIAVAESSDEDEDYPWSDQYEYHCLYF